MNYRFTMQLTYPVYLFQFVFKDMPTAELVQLDDMYQYYCQYQAELIGYLCNKGFDAATAEDLLHDTFLKACKQVSKGKVTAENIRAWLYNIAHNTAISRYRKKKETYQAEIDTPGNDADITIATENKILQDEILAFVQKNFSEREREIFELRKVQELTYQETADILKMSKTTVIRVDENNVKRIIDHFGGLI